MKYTLIILTLIGGSLINTIHSSIVLQQINVEKITNVDAIVNPANQWLQHGGGIAGALSKAAGPQLQKDSDTIIQSQSSGALCAGSVVVTDSYDLSSNGIKKILHAVGPDCRNPAQNRNRKELLEKTYQNIFSTLKKEGLKSVALPSISTGIFAYPDINKAVDVALKYIINACRDGVDITIFANDIQTLKFYKRALKEARIPFKIILK